MARLEAILPKEPKHLSIGAVRLEVLNAMRKVGTQVKRDYRETTKTWRHKPKFSSKVSLARGRPVLDVYTEDIIYQYVDYGTRRHPIKAHNPSGRLHFMKTFYPKTIPGVLGSVKGASFPPWAAPQEVMHPGTKARRFTPLIEARHSRSLSIAIDGAIKRALEKSGHLA